MARLFFVSGLYWKPSAKTYGAIVHDSRLPKGKILSSSSSSNTPF